MAETKKHIVTVESWDPTADGALSEENFRRKLSARGYDCCLYTYPPGTFFPDHVHAVDKIDGVLQGRFRIRMHGESHVLGPGDCIQVPKGVTHSAEVMGDTPVTSIDGEKS